MGGGIAVNAVDSTVVAIRMFDPKEKGESD